MIYVTHNGNASRMPETFDEYVPTPPPPPSLGNDASSFYAHYLAAGTTNQPAPATNAPVIPKLKGIVVLGTIANVQTNGAPGVTGIQVKGPAFLGVKEARRKLAAYLGKPVTNADLTEMRKDLVRLCRAADRPVVDVVLPEQEVVDGVVQLVVVEGRLGQLEINNPGRQWTREQALRDSVRIKPGDPLRQTRLLEDLDWINRNPFRDVTVSFRPGEVGETDVILNVDDRLPFRAYTRYDNHGMRALGKQQLAAGFNWQVPYTDNHFLNYEYLTDSYFNKLKAHVFSWEALLPWRHRLTFLGYYSESEADISSLYSGLSQKGDNWMN
ncbi:MAG: POTRA domain-containing protein, partial [Verrucomicrobiota bacterium]|nr:POTRA domain-containing protein [Verrucomicrobiota bacterium]